MLYLLNRFLNSMLTYCILLSTCKGFLLVHKTFQNQNINLHKFTKRFYQQKLRDYILQKHVDGFSPFQSNGHDILSWNLEYVHSNATSSFFQSIKNGSVFSEKVGNWHDWWKPPCLFYGYLMFIDEYTVASYIGYGTSYLIPTTTFRAQNLDAILILISIILVWRIVNY